jgi:hypothetical protein
MRLIYNGTDLGLVVAVKHDADVPPGKNGKPLYGAIRVEAEVTLPPGPGEVGDA